MRNLVPDLHDQVAKVLEPVLVYIAFLRLYLGAATKSDIARLARANAIVRAVKSLKNVEVENLVDAVWNGLVRVTTPAKGYWCPRCLTVTL